MDEVLRLPRLFSDNKARLHLKVISGASVSPMM
jgi:hypothetical protein